MDRGQACSDGGSVVVSILITMIIGIHVMNAVVGKLNINGSEINQTCGCGSPVAFWALPLFLIGAAISFHGVKEWVATR